MNTKFDTTISITKDMAIALHEALEVSYFEGLLLGVNHLVDFAELVKDCYPDIHKKSTVIDVILGEAND